MATLKPLLAAKAPTPADSSPDAAPSPRPSASVSRSGGVGLSVSKTYVVPPRPKPGRKPSTDTPQNRRKAQNREAQRAFRERRSQAVRELEAKLAEQARLHAEQQSQLMEQINKLKQNATSNHPSPELKTESDQPIARSLPSSVNIPSMMPNGSGNGNGNGNGMDMQSQQRVTLPRITFPNHAPMPPHSAPVSQAPSPGFFAYTTGMSPTSIAFPFSPGPSGASVMSAPSPQFSGSPPSTTSQSPYATPMSPAGTSPITTIVDPGMELLDHVLDQKLPVPKANSGAFKKLRKSSISKIRTPRTPQSPIPPTEGLELTTVEWSLPSVPLRRRLSTLETDFTLKFKTRRRSHSHIEVPVLPLSPPSPMGSSPLSTGQSRAPLDRCGFCTDDTPCICAEAAAREQANMSDVEMLGSVETLPPLTPESSSATQPSPLATAPQDPQECTGNPGTCNQCRGDPMSTLFCSTVSSKPTSANASARGTYIPAQAAYQTLSRHNNFKNADFGAVISTLVTRGTQVEVNSVAKVLRLLDTGSSF